MFSPSWWFWPFAHLETPFTKYLESTLKIIEIADRTSMDPFVILETLRVYIHHGANLDEMVTLFFNITQSHSQDRQESSWRLGLLENSYFSASGGWPGQGDSLLFVSFPARIILDALLHIMRQGNPSPVEGTKSRDSFSFLEAQC